MLGFRYTRVKEGGGAGASPGGGLRITQRKQIPTLYLNAVHAVRVRLIAAEKSRTKAPKESMPLYLLMQTL